MIQHADVVARYKQLRNASFSLNTCLTKTLTKDAIEEAGRKLGVFKHGKLILDSEDEIAVVMDFCLHDVRRKGINAIERYLAENPPPLGSDELLLLRAKCESRYSLFSVEATEPGRGVHLHDLLNDERVFLIDINFSTTAPVGTFFATRIFTVDGITMSTGATLPIGVPATPAIREQFLRVNVPTLQGIRSRQITPEQVSEINATLIRTALSKGGASQMRYAEPGEVFDPEPAPMTTQHREWSQNTGTHQRVGRNDRCPCQSGKKFKYCCGGRK